MMNYMMIANVDVLYRAEDCAGRRFCAILRAFRIRSGRAPADAVRYRRYQFRKRRSSCNPTGPALRTYVCTKLQSIKIKF